MVYCGEGGGGGVRVKGEEGRGGGAEQQANLQLNSLCRVLQGQLHNTGVIMHETTVRDKGGRRRVERGYQLQRPTCRGWRRRAACDQTPRPGAGRIHLHKRARSGGGWRLQSPDVGGNSRRQTHLRSSPRRAGWSCSGRTCVPTAPNVCKGVREESDDRRPQPYMQHPSTNLSAWPSECTSCRSPRHCWREQPIKPQDRHIHRFSRTSHSRHWLAAAGA